MPTIIFSLHARTKLEQRLARALAQNANALRIAMDDIEARLDQAFPNARIVLVQDLYQGFRARKGEYVVLIEVADSDDEDGPAVVKLGPANELQKELDAWRSCRPHGVRRDLVLMGVEPCYHEGQLIALRYEDAEQLIGVDQSRTLESALLDAVRLGSPTPDSVADVLFQLYERLGLLLYRHTFDEDPGAEGYVFEPRLLDPKLTANLAAWDGGNPQAFMTRSAVTTVLDDMGLRESFRDPAAMLKWILDRPQPGDHVPHMLRGRSHGDLHGRNVLVGQVDDRVLWPAVFDYGAMGRANLIGWDFVKMETEFKQRAYSLVFPPANLVSDVVRFETMLFEATEQMRNTGVLPDLPDKPTPLDRLRWLVLTIRQLAGTHLGRPNRSALWLHEYYFLLAVYGLNAGRFDNLTPTEQRAAYLSAGTAADRFADTFRQRSTAQEKPR